MSFIPRIIICTTAGILLNACADYSFSVNERIVYNPDPLFTDYQIPDPGLQRCVRRFIEQEKISSVSQVQELDCRDSDIVRLDGLEVFVSLRYLNLEGNGALSCPSPKSPLVQSGVNLVLPQHCPSR
jgi:hypothetical protein